MGGTPEGHPEGWMDGTVYGFTGTSVAKPHGGGLPCPRKMRSAS